MPARPREKKNPKLRLPPMPVATAIHEARLLFDAASAHRQRFAALPDFQPEVIDALKPLADALEERERAWIALKAQDAGRSKRLVHEEARRLRSTFRKAARYLLRKNADAQAELDDFDKTRTIAGLASDLETIAFMAKKHRAKLAVDPDLPPDLAKAARDLVKRMVSSKGFFEANEALGERNLAYWRLDEAVTEVRAGARYLFRRKPDVLAKMLSAYKASEVRRRRAKRGRSVSKPK